MAPGCSAVSPPSSAQPAWPAAVGDALHQLGQPLRGHATDGHVVEQEEGLGADAHEVVDAHGHEVEAEGVEAPDGPGDEGLGADAVGAGHEHRVGGSGRGRAANRPPKPPIAETTPGRAVEAAIRAIRATAASAAAMSTPAAA